MPKLDKFGRIEFNNISEKELGPVWQNGIKDIMIDYLAELATHPKAIKFLMTLEMGKEYKCNKRRHLGGPGSRCIPELMFLQGMINHYMGGTYELSWSGELVQKIITLHKD